MEKTILHRSTSSNLEKKRWWRDQLAWHGYQTLHDRGVFSSDSVTNRKCNQLTDDTGYRIDDVND